MELYLQILAASATILLFFFFVSNHFVKRNGSSFIIPINWPLVGMLPHLLLNVHRFHDWSIQLLQTTDDGTFLFKGPWFSSMELLLTTDPANVHHVMSKNFSNFPKGHDYSMIFDILGDGIFNADFELWRYQRKVAHSFLTNPSFHRFLAQTLISKVEKGLIPILDAGFKSGRVLNLEDLFQRFTFDTICTLVTGTDPARLDVSLPDAPFCKALDDAEGVLFLRHIVPETVWKLQRWLGIGSEKRLRRAWEVLDGFIYNALAIKRQEMNNYCQDSRHDGGVDLLTLYMQAKGSTDDQDLRLFDDNFLRDMFLNLLIAGRDTTSSALTWFFFLLHKNPRVEAKIRQEIESIGGTGRGSGGVFQIEEMGKLVYLHSALCETLRLYPPVPFEHKSPLEADVLPSGHHAKTTTKIIFTLYAMGRSKSVWGDDSFEFKPERWITKSGRAKHEPSYKFLAFNAGPRTCIGKEMAFLQMKAVVASVLGNGYRLQVLDEEKVEPDISIILHTKHGLKAKVMKEPSS